MKRKSKQIAAIIAIVLLAALYLFTLVAALLDFEGWDRLFQASLVATIGLPILLWIYIWLYGKVTGRSTLSSFHAGLSSGEENEEKNRNQTS